jgi:3',5'-cyclic-AMP phosphodiesterase
VIQTGNVRAVISGHLHLVERIEMMGQTFIGCGSASGHKWTGPRLDTLPGLAIFDCYPDGKFTYTSHDHGWETRG